jgi:hypothetical protein
MSVDICVGMLDEVNWAEYREGFLETAATLRQILRDSGAPDYEEPILHKQSWSAGVCPSNGIAFLQRFAAYLDSPDEEEWPTPGDPKTMSNPLEDDMVTDYYSLSQEGPSQHLVFHNPRYGYWLPVDFPDVILPDETLGVGNIVGSSVRLLAECERLAQLLDLPLDMHPDDKRMDIVFDHPGIGAIGWTRYGIESRNLLVLYRACRKSVELGAAIFLC